MRKIVTVLFADLGGSTGFAERTDPETAREVMAIYHATMLAAVEAHGGTVAKFIGDGVMAVWGIPEVSEDDATRGVLAAAQMQEQFVSFAADVSERLGEPMALRIGINTGEVVIAEGDADIVGDALNVAARLEKACQPGRVLVGEETWRLTRGELGYESLGDVSVSGRAEPVAVFELAAGAGEGPRATPFVGRDGEIRRLRTVFDEAVASDEARFVTVLGSPGVGKTRLARELVTSLGDAVTAFDLRCDRAGDATLAPAVELIRAVAELGDGLEPAATRERLAGLLTTDASERERVVDGLMGIVGAAPARSTEETFWAFRRLLETLATDQPVVVVIDDIQWAESLLLDLLEHLAEWVREAPVLLVGLARPELREVRPALAEVGRRMADVLALDGLDARATEELAARLLGTDHLPPELVARLPASTDGNPLFVRELVRMLVDDQVIERRGDTWELAIDADAVEVPPTIQSLLAARIERLPEDERALLELASVVGAEFSLGALRDLVAEDAVGSVDLSLERLRRKELVEPTGTYWGDQPVHRFHHVLIRDATYRRLLKRTRAELHEQVGRWTDDAAAGIMGEHEAVIAFHYEQAHEYRRQLGPLDDHARSLGRRAAELLTVAAERALERDDLAAAGALATRALARLDADQADERAQLLLVGCEALLSSGDVVTARPLVEQLTELAADDHRLAAWAACFTAQLVSLTDPEGIIAAEATATEAAETLRAIGDGAGEAKAHLVRANLLARLGQVATCEGELDLALAAARAADDRRRVIAVLGAAPVVALWGPSPVARAGGRCLDVVRLLRITSASPAVEATSMRCQAVLEALRGRMDTAHSMLDRARAMLVELGLQHDLMETELLVGVVALIDNDPIAAEAPLRAAYGGLGALGVGADAGQAAALLARSLLAQGRVDEADEMAKASEALAGQNLKTAIAWRSARAEVGAAHGEATAVAIAEEAVAIAAGTDLVLDHADACAALARVRDIAGDPQGAAAARREASDLYAAKGATNLAGEEPAPPAPAPDEARSGGADNQATTLIREACALITSGDIDALGSLIGIDYVSVDRRVGMANRIAGHAENLAAMQVFHEVLHGATYDVAAVVAQRGERLSLVRAVVNGGFTTEFLLVAEYDTDGRSSYSCVFDPDDLDTALGELEARYAGQRSLEPGRFADDVRSGDSDNAATWFMKRGCELITSGDVDAFGALVSRDYLVVDHRVLAGTSIEGRAENIEGARVLHDLLRGATFEVGAVVSQRGERLSLVRVVVMGRWDVEALHLVELDPDGTAARTDVFDPGDLDTALRELDARYATPRGLAAVPGELSPLAENETTAMMAEFNQLLGRGEYDAMAQLLTEDFVRVDRRHGVFDVPAIGPDAYIAAIRSVQDVGLRWISTVPIAVRGRRHSLHRVHFESAGGDELRLLTTIETNEAGLARYSVLFDADDLTGALDQLDEAFLAGEGAAGAPAIQASRRYHRAYAERDFDAIEAMLHADFITVDHRRLGFGTQDRAGWIERDRSHIAVTPDTVNVPRTLHASGNVSLKSHDQYGTTPDGNVYEWPLHGVSTVDDHGLITRVELFDDDDYPTAVARFRELSGDPRPSDPRSPKAENTATRNADRVADLAAADRFDEIEALISPSYVRYDHRRGTPAPTAHGPADWIAFTRATREVGFDDIRLEHLAVRGERLRLTRLEVRAPDGREIIFLGVYEDDEQGRLVYGAHYDEDDLARAIAELQARHIAGEGAHDTTALRGGAALVDAFHARDWVAVAANVSAVFVAVDHRGLWPPMNRAAYIDRMRSLAETMPGAILTVKKVLVSHRASLDVVDTIGTTEQGGQQSYRQYIVSIRDADGLLTYLEVFDDDAWTTALSRLDELGATAPSAIENTVTRANAAWVAAKNEERGHELEGLIAPGYTVVSHQFAGIVPPTEGVDEMREVSRAVDEVGFMRQTYEPIAVRGDRLALARLTATTEDGYLSERLELSEVDEQGRFIRTEIFDSDAIADATATLGRWWRQQVDPGLAPLANRAVELVAELVPIIETADWDRYRDHVASDVVGDDRRTAVNAGLSVGRERLLDLARGLVEVGFTTVAQTPIAIRGERLVLLRRRYHNPSSFDMDALALVEFDEHDQTCRNTLFDPDDIPAAMAELDERFAVGEGQPFATFVRESAEFWRLYNGREWDTMREYLGDAWVIVDHRLASAGTIQSAADFVDYARAMVELAPDLVAYEDEYLALGTRCGLSRVVARGTSTDGAEIEVVALSLAEMVDGTFARGEMFAPEELDQAMARFNDLEASSPS